MDANLTLCRAAVPRARIIVSWWTILLAAGCRLLPGSDLATISGDTIEVSSIPGPAPTVVFEAGLASSKKTWEKVIREIATSNAVFAYNRPGIGRSAASSRPRDGATIVEELRTLLRERQVRPPYVLVGHSAGGLYMQLFARRYPSEVVGLVLVDPTHPTQFEGAGDLKNRSRFAMTIITVAGVFGPTKTEFDALGETGRQVLSAPPVPDAIPIRILTAPDKSGTPVAAFDNAKREDFAREYPQAIVSRIDSSHNIQHDKPEVVIEAIRDVVTASRVPKRMPPR